MRKNGSKDLWTPKTAEDRAAVHEELEAIIASELFRSSGRYPAFLRHIVEKTLNGQVADLKERTLGIEVFHRESAYNTADDPVVRVCGSEVRRRIAQFYQQSPERHEIEIELPPGRYVPQFWRAAPGEVPGPEISQQVNGSDLAASGPGTESKAAEGRAAEEPQTKRSRLNWLVPFVAGLLVEGLAVGAVKVTLDRRQANSSIMQVWNPLLTNPNPVLISVGRPHPPDESKFPPLSETTIRGHFFQPSFRVSITAVAAISQIAGFLEMRQKTFSVHESDSNVLDDLHNRPVVLINGNDNKWAVLLLKPLRFHLEPYPGKGRDASYVADTQHPERRDWMVDNNQPFLQQTVDYAIVGRFYCPTTNGPVVVIAGLSSNGTEAGGEFMASPERLAELAHRAHASLDKNFEAVLKVEVVGGNTGAATPIASQFW